MYAGGGEQVVSERTLRRWTRRVVLRLAPLSHYLGLCAPAEAVTTVDKQVWLLDQVEPVELLGFRTLTGYGLLDMGKQVYEDIKAGRLGKAKVPA